MAKGYPEPKEAPVDIIPGLVPEGMCVICKRRPTATARDKCAICIEILSKP